MPHGSRELGPDRSVGGAEGSDGSQPRHRAEDAPSAGGRARHPAAHGHRDRTWFDEFAEWASTVSGSHLFFALCVLLVLVWLPTFPLFPDLGAWQFVINTVTGVLTFLLVGIIQNSQRRAEHALNEKLNALAEGLADLMRHVGDREQLAGDIEELKAAVGLEHEIGVPQVERPHRPGRNARRK